MKLKKEALYFFRLRNFIQFIPHIGGSDAFFGILKTKTFSKIYKKILERHILKNPSFDCIDKILNPIMGKVFNVF